MNIMYIKGFYKRQVVVFDFAVRLFTVADKIHFVDGDDNMSDTQQRHDKAVTFRLGLHAVAGVDQNHR